MKNTGCMLCPRMCGVDRKSGIRGYCGAGADIVIGRYGLHHWEEPCISGKNGSGTVFFSHCTLRCVYCQNYAISTQHRGKPINRDELCNIFLQLQSDGAHNINLVTPTHYVDEIIPALDAAKSAGLHIPVIYNTSGYERVETLKGLEGYIDVYLPDFKYYRSKYSDLYSSAPDYFSVTKAAIDEMARQTLPAVYDGGMIKRGLIIRHLLLPGLLYDAKKIIDYLYNAYGDSVTISIMSQYTPLAHVADIPALNRTVGAREYDTLCEYAASLGITNAYTQDGSAAKESFIPDFYDT